MFDAILLTQTDDKKTRAAVESIDESRLPAGEVRVRIAHSTLNYKDALAITGKSPVVRAFPMVPGVDFAGTVVESSDARFTAGDVVILNGFGVGESHWGGLAGQARVKADWLVKMPRGLDTEQAMSIGTAGYTSMLCVMALERNGVVASKGPILVTGANGGVGSIAITLLAKLGYTVHASTGRLEESDHLKSLGASEIIARDTLAAPGKPLQKERWSGVIDSVGSHTLANACAQTAYGGTVAACGLAQGMDFPASVAPFILRGVTLAGVDSVQAPMARRVEAWERLDRELPRDLLATNTRRIGLADVIALASDLLAGTVRGRVVVAI